MPINASKENKRIAHTPGPWEFFTEGSPIRGLQKKYLKSSTTNQGFAHTVGLHEPTDTANARLIAAAPELANRLDDLIADARLLRQCPEPDLCDICKAEAVLRKARGE